MYSCCARNRLKSPPAPYYEVDGMGPEPYASERATDAFSGAASEKLQSERENPPLELVNSGERHTEPVYELEEYEEEVSQTADRALTQHISEQIEELEDFNSGSPAFRHNLLSSSNGSENAALESMRGVLLQNDSEPRISGRETAGGGLMAKNSTVNDEQSVEIEIITCQLERRRHNPQIKCVSRTSGCSSPLKKANRPEKPADSPIEVINAVISPKKAGFKEEIRIKQFQTPQKGQTQYQYVSEHPSARINESQMSALDDNIEAQISQIQGAIKPHVEFGDYILDDVSIPLGTNEQLVVPSVQEISPQIQQQRTAIDVQIQHLQAKSKETRPKSPFYNQFGFPDIASQPKLQNKARSSPIVAHKALQLPVPSARISRPYERRETAKPRVSQLNDSVTEAAEFLRTIKKTTVVSRPTTPHSRPRTPKSRPIQDFVVAEKAQPRPTSRGAAAKTPVLKISLMD